MPSLSQFQDFLYANIPLVGHMQLQIKQLDANQIMAAAPIAPNINDKATVFGGSSAALMTICGWSLIKYNLESLGIHNDVVIHKSKLEWQRAQQDDLIIQAQTASVIDWSDLAAELQSKNRPIKINTDSQILNQAEQVCSHMTARYVVLKK